MDARLLSVSDYRRLGEDANELRREHTAVVHGGLQSKEARHGAAAMAAGAAELQVMTHPCRKMHYHESAPPHETLCTRMDTCSSL